MNRIDQADVLRQGAMNRFQETGRKERPQGSADAVSKPVAADQGADRAEISPAARQLMELHDTLEIGRGAVDKLTDVREERVALAKQRLAEGYYQSVDVRGKVAEGVDSVFKEIDAL